MLHRSAVSELLLTGLGTTCLVLAISYAFSAPYSPEIYQSWVAFIGIASVPGLLVASMVWRYQHPAVLTRLDQPLRGCAHLALTILSMIAGGAFLYFVPGGGRGATPMLINASIVSIVVAFWLFGVWKCWPLTLFVRNQMVLGAIAWALVYVIGYATYMLFFNFSAVRHAPFYVAALDPGGLFDFWFALVFAVTTSGVIVALEKLFYASPADDWMGVRNPFLRVVIDSAWVLIISGVWMGAFVGLLKWDVVDFMLRGPIALIFGVFFVTNLSQSRLFPSMVQPRKGCALLLLAVLLGLLMEELYRFVAPLIAGRALGAGPPEYGLELWVATALLAVTFPIIVVVTGYFDFWPLKRRQLRNAMDAR